MPRRRCCGIVDSEPVCRRFAPLEQDSGQPVTLHFEEMEAIRLKDHKGMDQADCALTMGLSRPTFQRILHSARSKVATALVEGRAINIEGGNYIMKNRVFECSGCQHIWEEAPCSESGRHGYEIACPKCGGMKKMKLVNGIKHACGGGHHGSEGGCC